MKPCAYFFSLSLMILTVSSVAAQSRYPDRAIHLLYGFDGDGFVTRFLAERLARSLGQPVVVENVTGAAGNIAADRTANAAPDGYTFGMLTGANIVIRPLLHRKLAHDPLKVLVPVSLVYNFATILAVKNELAATTLDQLVSEARAEPGKLTFGHLGVGSVTHLAGELLKTRAKINIRGVPYRGPSALLTDVIGGRIAMTFSPAASALGMMQQGKVRVLAVTSRDRVPLAPDLPTMAELGYPGFEVTVWFGLFAPVGTPQFIIDWLNQEVSKIMRLPEVRTRLVGFGQLPIGSTQSEFNLLIRAETLYWTRLIRDAGIDHVD